MLPSRSVGGGVSSTAIASGVGGGRVGFPVVDMMEVRLRSRAGCRIASVWAIMPPMDAPQTCAASIPIASSRPAASFAMSSSE
jgi:hypothetical protein